MFRYRNDSHKFKKLCKQISNKLYIGYHPSQGELVNLEYAKWYLPRLVSQGIDEARGRYTYKLQRPLDKEWDTLPRIMTASCANCGQRCSFSVLEGKEYEEKVIAFVKAKGSEIKHCSKQSWYKPPRAKKEHSPGEWCKGEHATYGELALRRALGLRRNKSGGLMAPLPPKAR